MGMSAVNPAQRPSNALWRSFLVFRRLVRRRHRLRMRPVPIVRRGSVKLTMVRAPTIAAPALVLALASTPLFAVDYPGTPETYLQRVKQLKAGDRLLLRAGQYRNGLKLHGLRGTADAPIAIEGPAVGAPAIFLGRQNANTVSLRDSAHVAIRHLVLDGRNLPVDAVRVENRSNWAHHIALENLVIVNHGHDQQIVGISAQAPAWNWTIRGNVIIGSGTGMYLGSSDGRHPFVHGIIENNLVLDTIGYNLQIKHQGPRPAIAGMPSIDDATVIRGNVFLKGERSGRHRSARPNVLVGHFPASGAGMEDRYLVEGNVFFGNPTEALFQGEGNITLLGNLFINPYGDGIVLQPHHDVPRRVEVAHNFVATRGSPLRVRGTDPRFPAGVHDNETVDMPGPPWDRSDDNRSPLATELGRAVARWLATPAAANGISGDASSSLKRALRAACRDRADAARPEAWQAVHAETELLCSLVPRP